MFKCTCKKKQINIAHQKFHPKFENQKPKTKFNIFYKNAIDFPTNIAASARNIRNRIQLTNRNRNILLLFSLDE